MDVVVQLLGLLILPGLLGKQAKCMDLGIHTHTDFDLQTILYL